MHRLERYILKSFIGIFLKTLAISIFFLLMQMVWKYVDDLSGRGIDWGTIVELLFYWSVAVLPMATPVAVLFAGIMVFGNLAENHELAAVKTSGVSFYRLLRPLLYVLVLIATGMFFVANNLIPMANFKGENLLINIAKQRPTFNLQPGIFYHGIDGYSLKIGSKDEDEVFDLLLYDHRERGEGNHTLILSPHAKINYQEGSRWMEIELFDGTTYQEHQNSTSPQSHHPYIISSFNRMVLRINMGSFQLGNLYSVSRSNEFNMLNIQQLDWAIEDLTGKLHKRQGEVSSVMRNKYSGWILQSRNEDSSGMETFGAHRIDEHLLGRNRFAEITSAIHLIQSSRDHMEHIQSEFDWREQKIALHYLEYYKKFSIAVACILLFFIGAPLGAIIQKGGFGLSFVISVLLFLFHYVLIIIFEKMGREWIIAPFWAIWLPNLILLPVATWLTFWAANDGTTTHVSLWFRKWLINPFRAS